MSKQHIYTLEEDFQHLGLLGEMGPGHKGGMKKPYPKDKKEEDLKKKMAAMKGNASEDTDLTDEERESIEELRVIRRKKMRGVKALKARKRSKIYARAHRAASKRLRKSAKSKRRRKILAKLPKARKGYIRRTNIEGNDALGNIGGVLVSLGSSTPNGGPLQDEYMNIVRQATQIRKGYAGLAEEYVSTNVDFGDVSEAARGIAAEAAMMAKGLEENQNVISVSDQNLMDEHIDSLIEELDVLAAMLAETQAAVDIDEGVDEDEDVDDDVIDEMGYPPQNDEWGGTEAIPPTGSNDPYTGAPKAYTEHPMKPVHGHGDGPQDATFEIMHPLGISRVDHREKLVLKNQLSRETTEDEDEDFISLLDDVDNDLLEKRKRSFDLVKGKEGERGRYIKHPKTGKTIFIPSEYIVAP